MLGWESQDVKNVNEASSIIGEKGMTRNAITQSVITTSVSSCKSFWKITQIARDKVVCNKFGIANKKEIFEQKYTKFIKCSTCKQSLIKS